MTVHRGSQMTPQKLSPQRVASVAFSLCVASSSGGAPRTINPHHAALLTDRVQDALREAMISRKRGHAPVKPLESRAPKARAIRNDAIPEGDAAAALIERMVEEKRTQISICRELHWGRERLLAFCADRGIEINKGCAKVTPHVRAEVIRLRGDRVKIRDVAARLNIDPSTVGRIIREARHDQQS